MRAVSRAERGGPRDSACRLCRLAQLLILGLSCSSCLIPDIDIVVESSDPCGEHWLAQTLGAYGYNGIGEAYDIKSEDDRWVSQERCVSPSEGLLLLDEQSPAAQAALADIVSMCQARAIELELGDNDDSCVATAKLFYVDECILAEACVDTETGDEGPR